MAPSVLLEREAYQIRSLPITDRVALERRDFVCISRPEERKDAENLRREQPQIVDSIANSGQYEH
jgi:hypothetical protein